MTTTPRRHKTTEVICKNCHQPFQSLDTRLKEGRGEFCSKKCYQEYVSQDDVRRNSISSLGKENAVKAFDKTKNSYYVYWIDPETLKRKTSSYPRWWWEMNVGELEDGMVVSYKDGDSTNIDPSNFFVQTRKSSMKSLFTKLTGRKLSDETKKKLSNAHSGKTLSEEHKKKIGIRTKQFWNDGVFDTPEIRKAYSENAKKNVGRKASEESKDKMSRARKGKPQPQLRTDTAKENRRNSFISKKHHHDDEWKQKVSEKLQNREFTPEHLQKLKLVARRGEQSNLWRGGNFSTEYPPEFNQALKSKIRRRDKFVCRSCGKNLYKNPYSAVHHIDANKNNNSMDNLILLCKTCHGLVHGSSGSSTDTELIIILRTFIPQKP